MANNPYVNKVVKEGTTLIDLSSDTALAADVAQGKYFHLATGERVAGTASGGGGGAVTQDQDGYLVLSDQGSGSPTLITKNITQNGTYNASSDNADGYSSVTVNVSGGGGATLLASYEEEANTTSTSVTTLATYTVTGVPSADSLIFCVVTDKAGERAGYFYTSTVVFNGRVVGSKLSTTTRCNSDGTLSSLNGAYGVYFNSVQSDSIALNGSFTCNISTRYNANYTLTINGTYSIKFYAVPLSSLR